MKINYVSEPLGLCGNVFAPSRKEWIASAIGAGVGALSSIFGGISAGKAAREAERRQRAQEAKEDAWYARRYNEDYIDTAAGQNLVRRAKQFADSQWKKAAGAQAVSGGTAAATQMAKDAGNRMMGDTIANIAATDQHRKENVDNQHRAAEAQFAQMDMNREMQRAENITKAAQGASNAIMSAAGAIDQANAGKTSLGGSSNGGTPVQTGSVDYKAVAPTVSAEISSEGVLGKMAQGATDLEKLRAKQLIGGY